MGAIVLGASFALAQTTQPASLPAMTRYTPRVWIQPTATPPVIDAKLDDPAWENAARITYFQQVNPVEGAEPSERTEVRVTYDSANLYVAVYCFDSQPDKIVAKQRARDGDVGSDDIFTITFDPFNDQRNGYWFEFSPAGAKRDATVENGDSVRLEWDGIWNLKTAITDQGWFAEVAIPIKTISFNPDTDTWGFNVGRTIRRTQETVRWAGISRASGVRNVGNSGRISGISGLDQGLGLTFKPFITGNYQLDDNDLEIKPGFDLYYQITPSITAALTVNTDFAEADVDTRRVNLTRFPLFFPEKRAFFLQDAGIFSFGGISQSPLPFFSRRIGIVNGEQKDILAGAKVTGRQKQLSFGVLNVQMYPDDDLGDKNLSVVRATYDVLDQSNIGIIATQGDPSTPGDNTLVGADFNYRANNADGKIYDGHAFIQSAYNDPTDEVDPSRSGTDSSMGLRLRYPNDDWFIGGSWMTVGPHFRPAMGFVQRRGIHHYTGDLRRRWRNLLGLRRIDLGTSFGIYTDLTHDLQTVDAEVPRIELETDRADTLSAGILYNREVIDNPFHITRDVTIPSGDYPYTRAFAQVNTSDHRLFAGKIRFEAGDFYDGSRQDYVASLEIRPSASIFAALEGEWNDVHLPDGDFLVRIFRARFNVLFSPEISWNNSLQYDNQSEAGSFNSRLRWEWEPGQELFIVANRGFLVDNGSWNSTETEMSVKCGITLRF